MTTERWRRSRHLNVDHPQTALERLSARGPASGTYRLRIEPLEDRCLLAFAPAVQYPTGSYSHQLNTADFNNDGKLDLAVANNNSDQISILLGSGDGIFQPGTVLTTADQPFWVEACDLNNDGKIDLAVPNYGSDVLNIFLGNGNNTFQNRVDYAAGSFPTSVDSGDLNGDGKLDLVIVNNLGTSARVLIGNGNGTFQVGVDYPITQSFGVALGDVNGDGKLDVAASGYEAGVISVLLGNGNGTLQPRVDYAVGPHPSTVVLADFDRDGDLDMATPAFGASYVTVLFGNGGGAFPQRTDLPTGANPFDLSVADLNMDGKLDLAVGITAANPDTTYSVGVLQGNGNGTFQTQTLHNVGRRPSGVTSGDFNRDGSPDLATANTLSDNVSILLNTDPVPPATIGNFVWDDVDADGVQDIGEPGLGNIVVNLYDNAGFTRIATTTTNTSGHYLFTGLLAGNYVVQVVGPVHSIFSPLQQGSNSDADSDINPLTGRTATISLAAGQNLTLVDAGLQLDKAYYSFSRTDLSLTSSSGEPAVGYLNGDQHLDIAAPVINESASTSNIQLFYGTGNGTFSNGPSFVASLYAVGSRSADMNNDGRMDLVAGFNGSHEVQVLLRNANDTFAAPISMSTTQYPYGAIVADFNHDNKLDVTTSTHIGNTVDVFLQTTTGYTPRDSYSVGTSFYLDAADVNGDGWADIVASSLPANVKVLINKADGSGTFFQPVSYSSGGSDPYYVTLGDLNGDQANDIVVANYSGDTVGVLLNRGNGTFDDPLPLPVGKGPHGVRVADVDGDHRPDILVTNSFTTEYNVGVLLGHGDGTFEPQRKHAVGNRPYYITPGDFNEDGRIDLAVGNNYVVDASVSILLNSGPSSISSRVWRDTESDGIQDAGESGVAGAVVELFDPVDGVIGNGNDLSLGTRITDASGNYTFNNLTDGSYYIEFRPPVGFTFATQDAGGNDALDSDANNSTGRTAIFSLSGGQTDTSRAAGLVGSLPPFGFAISSGAGGSDAAKSVALDTAENVYVVGEFNGSIDLDQGPGLTTLVSAGDRDVYIAKYTSVGALVWARRVGGGGAEKVGNTGPSGSRHIQIDAANNVYVTLTFDSLQIDSDPGLGTAFLNRQGSSNDAAIIKLDANGSLIWSKNFGGASNTFGVALAIDVSQNVYTTGFFESGTTDFDPGPAVVPFTATGRDVFISKFTASGDLAWAKRIGGDQQDHSFSVAVDSAGNVYTTGDFGGPGSSGGYLVDFNPNAGVSNHSTLGDTDIFLLKLDTSGNFVWAERIGSTSHEHATSLAIDDTDNIYLVGTYESNSVDWDPNAGTSNQFLQGTVDTAVAKLSSAGDLLWARSFGGAGAATLGYDLTVDGAGRVHVAGKFSGTVDFDAGMSSIFLSSGGSEDVFVMTLDALGNYVAAQRYGGSGLDSALSITTLNGGAIYTTGYTTGAVDFDPGFGVAPSINAGAIDAFLLKLSFSNIGSLVWNDLNSNGIQDGGESGLGGVTVSAYTQAVGGVPVATVVTNASGQYTFNSLAAQTYYLEVTLPSGYILSPPDQGSDDALDSDFQRASHRTGPVVLSGGQNITSIDAGMYQPVTISGRKFNDLNGDGSDLTTIVTVIQPDSSVGEDTFNGRGGTGTEFRATHNHGGQTEFVVGMTGTNGQIERTLIRFPNLPALTANQELIGARLGLTPFAGVSSAPVEAYRMLQPWVEGTAAGTSNAGVSWQTFDGTNPWPGISGFRTLDGSGYHSLSAEIAAPIASGTLVNGVRNWLPLNSNVVTGWLSGAMANNGLMLRSLNENSGASSLNIYSSEHSVATDRPALELTLRSHEPGLPGWTIYVDLNNSGTLDGNEPFDITDANGEYEFTGLAAGNYTIREVQQVGWQQTSPGQLWQATKGSIVRRFDFSGSTLGPFETNRLMYDLETVGNEVWQATDGSIIQRFNFAGTLLGSYETNNSVTDLEVVGTEVWQATNGTTIQRLDRHGNVLGIINTGGGVNELTVVGTEVWQATNGTQIRRLDFNGNLLGSFDTQYAIRELRVVGNEVWQATSGSIIKRFNFSGNLLGSFETNRLMNSLAVVGAEVWQATDGSVIQRFDFGGSFLGSFESNSQTNDIETVGDAHSVTLTAGQTVNGIDFGNKYVATSLGTFVWHDLNGNGVQEAGEPGVAGVVVELFNSTDGIIGNGNDVSLSSQTTDANGLYSFTNTNPGSYYLRFRKPNGYIFTNRDAGGNDTLDNDANYYGFTEVLTLAAGQNDVTRDAGLRTAADRIVFASNRDGDFDIYEMDSNGANVVQLLNVAGSDNNGSWSPSGDKLLFSSDRDGDSEIYVMNADGSGLTKLTNNTSLDAGPVWSPDSSKISFVSQRDGNYEVYVMNADGSNQTRLTNNAATDLAPDWSPDGSRLVFYSDRTGGGDVYVMSATGGTPTRLTTSTAGDTTPHFSPDGTKIAFDSARDGDDEVWVMNADGSSQTQLTFNTQFDQGPRWSPDGTKLVFYRDLGPNREVFTMNANGTGEVNITNHSASDDNPTWSQKAVGSLGNFVWNDLDGDGIQDAGEPGMTGVTASVYTQAVGGVPVATTTTNGSGQYTFNALAAQTYYVEVTLPSGYILSPQDQGSDDAVDSDFHRASYRTGPVVLSAGQVLTSIDAGLYRPVTISGRKYNDLNGDGMDVTTSVVVLQPGPTDGKDALLSRGGTGTESRANTNYGTDAGFDVGQSGTSGEYHRSVVQFNNLPTLAADQSLVSARLGLTSSRGDLTSATLEAYRLNQAWIEDATEGSLGGYSGVTWQTYDGTHAWPGITGFRSTDGGGYTSASAEISNPLGSGPLFGATGTLNWFNLNAAKVQAWMTGSFPNNGMLLRSPQETSGISRMDIYSSDAVNPAVRPALELTIASLEPGLAGWTIYVDLNNDGDLDANEPFDITDSSGEYAFTDLPAGNYTIREVQQPGWVQTAPASGHHSLTLAAGAMATDREFGNQVGALQVLSLTPTATGFIADFNRDLNPAQLNLFDEGGVFGPADLALTGSSTGAVRGSVVVDSGLRRITFIATTGTLSPDTYSVVFRSGVNAFIDSQGGLLDGNHDNTTGDDYLGNFTLGNPTLGAITITAPNFTRGYGQPVNLPASASTGLPIAISNAQGVKSASFTLHYNAALLSITGATTVPGISGNVTLDTSMPGMAIVTVTSATQLSATSGSKTLVQLTASVPSNAPYGAKQILDLSNIDLLDTSPVPVELPSIDDDGIQIAAYFGDANGSQSYNAPDATATQRLIVGTNTGFTAYQLADPYLIADINGNSQVQSDDVTQIQRAIVGLSTPQIPLHPGLAPVASGGPDPIVSIPQNVVASVGETVTVPVELLVTEPTGITLAGADIAIAFNSSALELTNTDVGQLLIGFGLSVNTSTPGLVRLTLGGSPFDLAYSSSGVLATLQFTVIAGAGTTSSINLLQSSGSQQTALYDAAGRALTLSPAPTNADNDEVDGLISILSDAQQGLAWDQAVIDMAFDGENDFTTELLEEFVALN